MTYRREVEVIEDDHVPERHVTQRSNPMATVERVIVFIFSLIQLLIGLRIVLLLVAAREGNDIVSFIYNASEIFVAPFRGILGIEAVEAGQTALDVGAIVALIGWIIIELIIIGLLRLFRPATA